jgi:hypothetical protein
MKQYLGEEEEGPDGKVYYKLCMCTNLQCSPSSEVLGYIANLDDRIQNPDQLS